MSLVLHSGSGNKNAFKALIAAEYCGVKVELVKNFQMGVSNKTPEFIKMNPLGKIPVLETPDGAVFESNAIARYVARSKGDNLLYGGSLIEYARVEQWMDFAATEIDTNIARWLYPRLGYMPYIPAVGDRFISRKLVQRFYDKALAFGLKGYAKLHQPVLARLANWEGIKKSRSIREFDHHATCVVAKYETVDTYYRRCSSASYVGNVSVPLLCVSALDDPLCTREAIPWDECRANKNIVLATTPNGGHLAFFEGLTAGRLWWVGAVSEFLSALHDSSYMHRQKAEDHVLHSSLESSIDKSPYLNVLGDGMVAPVTNDRSVNDGPSCDQIVNELKLNNGVNGTRENEHAKEAENKSGIEVDAVPAQIPAGSAEQQGEKANMIHDVIAPVKRSINQLTRYQGRSVWLLAYISFVTSWPLLGSLAFIVFRKKFRNPFSVKQ